jgi:tetratricopeptide (TPR) repeat protein
LRADPKGPPSFFNASMNSTEAATIPATQAAPANPAAKMPQLRALLRQRRFAEALAGARALLAGFPRHRELLLLAGVAERFLGRPAEALKTLETLQGYHPEFSRVYEERGRCFVELKQAAEAIEAFTAAVQRNPSLIGVWRMLEGLYRMTGRGAESADAASRAAQLQALPAEILQASALYSDGELDVAEPLVREFLLAHGHHVEAMRLLARIGMARQVYDDAELLLAGVLDLAPDYRAARQDYASVLVELHKHEQARRQLDLLLKQDPDNRELRTIDALNAVGVGEHERAIQLYRSLLQGSPADADVHLSIAHAEKTLGRSRQAIDSYRRAASCRPEFGDAYWSLANLKTYRFTDAELAHMRAAESAPSTGTFDRYHLSFALGKALEDRGEYGESFRFYELGNALKRAESRYEPEIIELNARRQIEVCTAEFFASRRGWGAPDPDPIFIIGLPRSGSTLIEQILASHSKIEGTHELVHIPQMARAMRGRDPDPRNPRYPGILAQMSAEEFAALGQQYLAAARIYRTDKPFFIDKMPNNLRHIGLIHLMLPNARIIDARREPMACCFSNLKQLFAQGQEFSYSIEDVARYYRMYLDLMRHWDAVLPGRILRVQHEEVVADLPGNVRRILAFCGLQFEDRCVEFHKTERSVRTASAEQVRKPISREGLDHWKHFEPWLEPLKVALGDALTRYRE